MQQTAGGLPEGRHCSLLLLLFYIRTIEWAHPERLTFTVTRLLQKDIKHKKNKKTNKRHLLKQTSGKKKEKTWASAGAGNTEIHPKDSAFQMFDQVFRPARHGTFGLTHPSDKEPTGSVWQVLEVIGPNSSLSCCTGPISPVFHHSLRYIIALLLAKTHKYVKLILCQSQSQHNGNVFTVSKSLECFSVFSF